MRVVKCEICGFEMKSRVNGSHLKSKHNITIQEYTERYPNASLGKYSTKNFNCRVCSKTINGNAAIKLKHLQEHGFNSVDEYNKIYEKKYCLCGCGELSEYSDARHKYNDYISGHHEVWNKGLLKETDDRIKNSKAGGWNAGLTVDTDSRQRQAIDSMKKTKSEWSAEQIKIMTNKIKKTWLKKYGVENVFMLDSVKEKIKKTNLQKYGVEYHNQNEQVYSKNIKHRLDYKDYYTPSGKLLRVQGYEPFALDILLKDYDEESIITDRKQFPTFWYVATGRKHRYYPDIFIKPHNRFIEVKSEWTYNTNEERIRLKCESVLGAGYDIDVWILGRKGEMINEINFRRKLNV